MVEEVIIGDPVDNLAGYNVPGGDGAAAGSLHRQLEQEQQNLRYPFCAKIKSCGHRCKGVEGETECFPCPNIVCTEDRNNPQDEL